MFILGVESVRNPRTAWVTWGLIAANVLVFAAELFLGPRFIVGFSMVPYEITRGVDLDDPPTPRARGRCS